MTSASTQAGHALGSRDGWERVDATDTVAKDFVGLRRRGYAAKRAVETTAVFHGLSESRVLSAYAQWEYARLSL